MYAYCMDSQQLNGIFSFGKTEIVFIFLYNLVKNFQCIVVDLKQQLC